MARCFLKEVKLFAMIPCQGLLYIRRHKYIAGKLTGNVGVFLLGGRIPPGASRAVAEQHGGCPAPPAAHVNPPEQVTAV